MRSVSLALLLLMAMSGIASGNDEDVWEVFVGDPSEPNFRRCEVEIRDSLSGNYEQFKSPTIRHLMRNNLGEVLALVESGNAYASELCFQFYPLFSGYPNIQEHIDVARGRLIRMNPSLFLKLVSQYEKPFENSSNLDNLVGNYGDEFVDQWGKKRKETLDRIEALSHVPNYEGVKSRCIQSLRRLLDQVNQGIIEQHDTRP